jgi:hypothetical protein
MSCKSSLGQAALNPFYSLETGTMFSAGGQTPFWLYSNHFGKNSIDPLSLFISAKIYSEPNPVKKISLFYGLEITDRLDKNNSLWIQQSYLGAKFWFINMRVGSKEETYGNQDSTLSSGSLLWSENTRPMPKLVISSDGYFDVPFTWGYLELSGLISHGWFGDDGYVKDAYLHHKYAYARAGGDLPVNISMGLQHYAIWGGISPDSTVGELPSDLNAYYRVFFSKHRNESDPNLPQNESLNRIGDHLGSWNYAIDVKLKKYLTGIYYQTIFEDYSGFRKFLMKDGLWGLYFKIKDSRKILNNFLFEYINTSYQSGPPQTISNQYTKGNDNFFNNSIYKSGWTYFQNTIGTPFITSPAYSGKDVTKIQNNRVIAQNLGISGFLPDDINYRLIISSAKNLGTYLNPYQKARWSQSAFLELNKTLERLPGFEVSVQAAFDLGRQYGNNAGVMISVKKTGKIKN